MSSEATQPVQNVPDSKPVDNNKELNFRRQAEAYERKLAEERARVERLEAMLQEKNKLSIEEEDDNEPYVDNKKLEKKLAKTEAKLEKKTEVQIQQFVQDALQKEREQMWLKQNPDFFDTMQHADKILQLDPELAETILQMPDNFERKKLVYRSIKTMRLDKPQEKAPSIQEKIDANRRSPYYQPSGIANGPYAAMGDFSPSGQKNSYEQMQKLKQQLRI